MQHPLPNLLPGAKWLLLVWTSVVPGTEPVWAADDMTGDPLAMPYYTGNISPTPQRVTYQDTFVSLAKTGILVGKDVENPLPLVQLLLDRITRHGGAARVVQAPEGDLTALISLGQTDLAVQPGLPAAPEREQAYRITSGTVGGGTVVFLKGHERQGLLWAISSFNQLVHREDGQPRWRRAEVTDYPISLRRGYLYGNIGGVEAGTPARLSALYNVAFKFNTPIYKHLCRNYYNLKHRPGAWRDLTQHAQELHNIEAIGALLTPLGLDWYGGLHPFVGPDDQKLNGSPQDLALLAAIARPVLAAGGRFYLQFDDYRFHLHPYDQEHFGTAREADYHLLSELDKVLLRQHPRARILVVPPFYWGPLGSVPDWYREPREAYLKKMGELPPNIEIQWTGPRVKSATVEKAQVEWMTGLIKRKPVYWQNGWGTSHPNYEHYVADPVTCWSQWYYEGLAQDLECHTFNANFPADAALLATLADYFWNPKAYEAGKSVAEAASKLVGARCGKTLAALASELTYFDPYGGNVTPAAARNLPELTTHGRRVDQLWAEATTQSKALTTYSGLRSSVRRVKAFVEAVRANPGFGAAAQQVEEIKRYATLETKLEEMNDLFVSPHEFLGGLGPRDYATDCPRRVALWMYGAESAVNTARLKFPLKTFPAAGDCQLLLSGQDGGLGDRACDLRISVNGQVIFAGGSPFPKHGWSLHAYPVPAKTMKALNDLLIEVTAPGYRGQPPWFMINYLVVRPAK